MTAVSGPVDGTSPSQAKTRGDVPRSAAWVRPERQQHGDRLLLSV